MTNNNDQAAAAIQKKTLESAVKLAQISIENSQRILELQMHVAREIFEDGVSSAKALAQAKTPQEAMELRTRYSQQAAEKVFACSRGIAEITADIQTAMSKMVSQQLTHGSQEIMESMQGFLKGMPMPMNNHAAIETLQNSFEVARKTLEQVTKASTDAIASFAQSSTPKKR
ncbi:MAG TPA: phasin family protein [Rhodocyclaceae bacterium]|nr:phasin family protein [Rhodocyclaceae bacterium]